MDTKVAGRRGGKVGGLSKSRKKRTAVRANLVKARAARWQKKRGAK